MEKDLELPWKVHIVEAVLKKSYKGFFWRDVRYSSELELELDAEQFKR